MGSAACRSKVVQYDESVQMPSVSPTTPLVTPPPVVRLPSAGFDQREFHVQNNTEQYLSVWDSNGKLSSTFPNSLRTRSSRKEHHQKESLNTRWSKTSSAHFESTRVESTVNSQTHSCINLSTSERINELIENLNDIHTEQDESIKRRTQQISTETESVLAHIVNETEEEQQRLLHYAKEQQGKQDAHYRQLLQAYVSQLDEMKAKELAQLQEELHDCRERIIQVSQLKIMYVNEQANIAKAQIVKEEQGQASMKIDAINTHLHNLPEDETFQQLGSEIVTKTNVTVSATVGSKAPGQRCAHEVVEELVDEPSRRGYAKPTYSDATVRRRSDQEAIIAQPAKRLPVNTAAQSQRSR